VLFDYICSRLSAELTSRVLVSVQTCYTPEKSKFTQKYVIQCYRNKHSITTANPSIESCVYTGITLEMSVGFPVLAGVLAVLVLENDK